MAIQKEFVVRYRDSGHVRFQIPSSAVEPRVAKLITDKIEAIDGVYAVKLFRRSKKLSIRYDEFACGFVELAKQLFQILADMEQQDYFNPQAVAERANKIGLRQRFKHSRIGRWFGDKVDAAKETAQAAKLIGKFSSKGPRALIKDPEKAVIDFLNDILVLYLIKIHWTRITQEWLVRPFVHRYEWMATFYLFFLLVRSRSRKPK